MGNRLGVVILFLLSHFCFGQTQLRQSLHGQVINDSIAVENGYVFNLNSKTTTFIGANGFFDIMAMPKDTLLLTSLALKSKKMVLTDMDFKQRLFVVKTELFNNQLKEVVVRKQITPKILSSKEILGMKFMDDAQSSPINRTMPYYGIENGADFGEIFTLIGGLFKKKNGKKLSTLPDEIFMEKVQRDFKPEFFKNTLKLKDEEVALFLIFCEADENAKKILNSNNTFQMMDFLITKNIAFKKLLQSK
ncbi:hypothetical protein [Flavobacterium laiguense]|uniref:Uncharacterized protein n=1 Tax=Flavobacterium laiguense TaxID=2169409 RepID=A0A2U1JT76_9FLAO|nr:hypothetical protein [Flavobacterium laiguense]PWA08371.1 hypothetical protein DB891_12265 [Flavobacterium laiguense]